MSNRSRRNASAGQHKLKSAQTMLSVAIVAWVLIEMIAPEWLGAWQTVAGAQWLLETSLYPVARLRSQGLREDQLVYVVGLYLLVGASYVMLIFQSTWLSLRSTPVDLPPRGYLRRYLYFHSRYVYPGTGTVLSVLLPNLRVLSGDLPLRRTDSKTHIRESNHQIDAVGVYAFGVLAFFMMIEGGTAGRFSLGVLLFVLTQFHVLFDAILYIVSRSTSGKG